MRSTVVAGIVLVLMLSQGSPGTGLERRVHFSPGTSGAVLTGAVDPSRAARGSDGTDRYVLGAGRGQTLEVSLKASGHAYLYVWHGDYNNGSLASGSGSHPSCTVRLPADGDYYVDVGPGRELRPFDYTLTVTIQ